MRVSHRLAVAGALLFFGACDSTPKDAVSGGSASTTASTPGPAGSATTTGSDDATAVPETPPGTLPSEPAAAVKEFYSRAGAELTDSEAACIVASTGPDIVAPLTASLTGGTIDEVTSRALLKAFSTCEPAAYISQTTANLSEASGATQEQATCTLHAVDKLLASDEAVLTQAATNSSPKDWPAGELQRFTDAVKTCVPDDLATKIINA